MVRFLCLATALLNPRPPLLVAIDEPELGLHPGLLPIVAEMIKVAAERTQVLVTTHSPDLLNCFDIADVAVMARNADDAKVCVASSRESQDACANARKILLAKLWAIYTVPANWRPAYEGVGFCGREFGS